MKKTILTIFAIAMTSIVSAQTADEILDKIDANMSAENMIAKTSMTINGKRNSRTLTSVSYTVGSKKAYTEYLTPARDKGTKMLKLEDKLWIYSPQTDRTIQISGHMLRQSVMGSDLSYEDMMDDRKLRDLYTAEIIGQETIGGRECIILQLTANTEKVAYYSQKIWVDSERFVPLREESFAKSGTLLKRTELSEVQQIDGRWYPMKIKFKDMLKSGGGTSYEMISVKFDQDIPEYIFSKAALKQ